MAPVRKQQANRMNLTASFTGTSEHDGLLNKILKHDMDFQGYVMSDWWVDLTKVASRTDPCNSGGHSDQGFLRVRQESFARKS